ARQRKAYNELFIDELVGFLSVRFAQFDLAVAADVLNYFGDLAPVFRAAAQAMRPSGIIAFTVEKLDTGRWKLNPSRRFAHSIEYVREVIKQTGFDVHSAKEVT